jgi:hypothetical protein
LEVPTVDVPISTSTTVATRDELFSTTEQLALAGFLAGYSAQVLPIASSPRLLMR